MPHFIFIQSISVLNVLNMLYNLHFFSSKCRLFHNATLFGFCITHILNTECAKIWRKKKVRHQKVNGDSVYKHPVTVFLWQCDSIAEMHCWKISSRLAVWMWLHLFMSHSFTDAAKARDRKVRCLLMSSRVDIIEMCIMLPACLRSWPSQGWH